MIMGTSTFPSSNVYKALNEDYYNRTGSYTSTGFTSDTRNLIENAKIYYIPSTSDRIFGYFDTAAGLFHQEHYHESNIILKVGLMQLSEWYFAAGEDCAKQALQYGGDINNCHENNWLYYGNFLSVDTSAKFISTSPTHTMETMDVSYSVVVTADNNANNKVQMGIISSSTSALVRPTVYLKSSVETISGDGSIDNPYELN